MPDPVYEGAVGMPIRLILLDDGAVHDPASATVREITIVKPDGSRLVKDGDDVTVETDSQDRACLEYVTVAADLDLPGKYRVQGYIEDAAGSWPTSVAVFPVTASIREAEVVP